eukprot:358109-Chlamydomonas_euryale.AAC.2
MHMHTHTHTYAHAHAYAHAHEYVNAHAHAHAHARTRMHTHTHTHVGHEGSRCDRAEEGRAYIMAGLGARIKAGHGGMHQGSVGACTRAEGAGSVLCGFNRKAAGRVCGLQHVTVSEQGGRHVCACGGARGGGTRAALIGMPHAGCMDAWMPHAGCMDAWMQRIRHPDRMHACRASSGTRRCMAAEGCIRGCRAADGSIR